MLLGDAISIYWTQTPKDEGIEIYLLGVESILCPLLVVQTFWMLSENSQHLEKDTLILLQKNVKETHGQIFGRVQLPLLYQYLQIESLGLRHSWLYQGQT